ncbi:I78 family peptidase inhibitor [Flavimaricola marinus]|uniref:Peptidase inhibitor I78 family protein n=1 Tax=Flavimaricola marinus TaxID=1819565 RepID=A0A238LHB0_9RHOB|nr:I78 family peptidase inhibitor [Flavimaricola marinus]SMY08346.1 Peptidase inhibitor I78 family protein [Flavimaricola marinus]
MTRLTFPILAVVLAGLTAGCTETPGSGPAICIAESYQDLVGGSERDALDTLVDVVLFSTNEIDIRYIRPGDAVTEDFRPERTNIELDGNDIVTRVYCG